jgi:hypothetical protein
LAEATEGLGLRLLKAGAGKPRRGLLKAGAGKPRRGLLKAGAGQPLNQVRANLGLVAIPKFLQIVRRILPPQRRP